MLGFNVDLKEATLEALTKLVNLFMLTVGQLGFDIAEKVATSDPEELHTIVKKLKEKDG